MAKKPIRSAPTEADVEKWANDLSQVNLECRIYGHSWRPWSAKWIPDERAYEDLVRCGRCKTERIKLLDDRGLVISSQYRYPPKYVQHAFGRLTPEARGLLRLEAVGRRINKPVARKGA